MPGVVSLPHGWGHYRSGTRLGPAADRPGASANDLTDDQAVDSSCGNAVLNGVPVRVEPIQNPG
jgi:arginase family enzyme